MVVLTFHPTTRLAALAEAFGGKSRDEAVADAGKALESMRGESDAVIEQSIGMLEELVRKAAVEEGCSQQYMQEILCLGDQIVTLAGTFTYKNLDIAARSLCDVTDGLIHQRRSNLASIQVHVQALRLMAPKSPPLTDEDVDKILSELAKIITFYGITRAADSAATGELEYSAVNDAQ